MVPAVDPRAASISVAHKSSISRPAASISSPALVAPLNAEHARARSLLTPLQSLATGREQGVAQAGFCIDLLALNSLLALNALPIDLRSGSPANHAKLLRDWLAAEQSLMPVPARHPFLLPRSLEGHRRALCLVARASAAAGRTRWLWGHPWEWGVAGWLLQPSSSCPFWPN